MGLVNYKTETQWPQRSAEKARQSYLFSLRVSRCFGAGEGAIYRLDLMQLTETEERLVATVQQAHRVWLRLRWRHDSE